MNVYAMIILTALLLDYFLNFVADLLNLQSLRPELPEEFLGVYDAEAYRRSQEYTRVHTYFGLVTSSCMLAITLLFWFAEGFQMLDVLVRQWDLGVIGNGLVYIAILALGRGLIGLPFSLYETFVIEARFGFNKTTLATFVSDMGKGLGLGIVLGGPLLAGLLAFLHYAGELAWLYCWIVTVAFTVFMQWLAPTWIMPLFNKFTPLEPGELKDAILAYARSVHFPVQDISVIDGSRRSGHSNAFFSGFGKHKRIALFDTLVEQHTVPELVAVLAHEIGHYKKRHIVRTLVLNVAHLGVMFYVLSIFLTQPGLFAAFYVQEPSVYVGLLLFGMLYTPVGFFLGMGMQLLSRRHEYEADHFAATTLGESMTMITALKKLAVTNLSNLTPHPFYVFLHYSHPPMLERLRALQRVATVG